MRPHRALPPLHNLEHPVLTVVRNQQPPPNALVFVARGALLGRKVGGIPDTFADAVGDNNGKHICGITLFHMVPENLHRKPWKHFSNMQFQHKNDWPVGWQYLGRVGRSVNHFPNDARMSNKLTKLLYFLMYRSSRSLIFVWRMSSFVCVGVMGTVGLGTGAGVAHWVGGGPRGAPPCDTTVVPVTSICEATLPVGLGWRYEMNQ
jgi:hypothetical protein